jgi:lipid-A-disaccharide synthase-like uncharacterized protein
MRACRAFCRQLRTAGRDGLLYAARARLGRNMELTTQWWLLAIGFTGQGFFFMRFFWQWIVSEREKKSIIPISFWYFSLFGSFFLLIYAILRRDIVFIVGQSTGSIIYIRNLYLIHRERKRLQSAG